MSLAAIPTSTIILSGYDEETGVDEIRRREAFLASLHINKEDDIQMLRMQQQVAYENIGDPKKEGKKDSLGMVSETLSGKPTTQGAQKKALKRKNVQMKKHILRSNGDDSDSEVEEDEDSDGGKGQRRVDSDDEVEEEVEVEEEEEGEENNNVNNNNNNSQISPPFLYGKIRQTDKAHPTLTDIFVFASKGGGGGGGDASSSSSSSSTTKGLPFVHPPLHPRQSATTSLPYSSSASYARSTSSGSGGGSGGGRDGRDKDRGERERDPIDVLKKSAQQLNALILNYSTTSPLVILPLPRYEKMKLEVPDSNPATSRSSSISSLGVGVGAAAASPPPSTTISPLPLPFSSSASSLPSSVGAASSPTNNCSSSPVPMPYEPSPSEEDEEACPQLSYLKYVETITSNLTNVLLVRGSGDEVIRGSKS